MIIDTTQILSLLGFSAVVSGIVSAGFNYFLTMKEFREKREMEFQSTRLEDRLRTYSHLVYSLNLANYYLPIINSYKNNPKEMQSTIGREYKSTEQELEKLLKKIDDTLPGQLYLLAPDIPRKWLELRSSESLKSSGKVNQLNVLLRRIEKEYYGNIVPSYNELMGKHSKYLRFDPQYEK